MNLIPDWKKAYRFFSLQAMAIATAILGAWMVLPDDLQATLPGWIPKAAAIVALVCGMVGRLVSQSPDPDATTPGPK